MNFPGKINKFDSSGNYKFSSTIPHNKCTMYKAEPKDVKRKKPSWRISGQTHVAVSKLSQPCLGSTGENGRKREKKNHEFSCVLQNLPYSKFNMYLYRWVLTFILILTGTSKDLPHFFLQLLISTCTCKSVIQRWYIHKASAKDIIFPTNLQNFVDIYKYIWWWWWCVCRGNIWLPTIPMSVNFRNFPELCLC